MEIVRVDVSTLRRGAHAVHLQALPPLALYVHIPWCLRKCPYCDFNSHQSVDEIPEARYLDALRADLEAALPQVWGRRVVSVFIGGGTPSLFAPESIERLIADVRARLPLQPGCEITMEANPGTFERERFRAFAAAGVTRLSIGVQSFSDTRLAALGRVHDAAQARAAVEEAHAAFDTFNVDLMYALPGQSLADCEADLREALALQPPHLSAYHLTLEPNTLFALAPPPALPDDDAAYAMLDRIVALSEEHGLERYEVSAYARPGHRCEHNLNYWRFGDYLGIGAGAHGKLSFADRIVRQMRWREPAAYMAKALAGQAVSNEHEVAARDLPFEFMLGALRLREGIELARFAERTGLSFTVLEAAIEQAQRHGLIEREHAGRIRPSARGLDFLSDLQTLFLPQDATRVTQPPAQSRPGIDPPSPIHSQFAVSPDPDVPPDGVDESAAPQCPGGELPKLPAGEAAGASASTPEPAAADAPSPAADLTEVTPTAGLSPAACAARLAELFPACFGAPRPLKLRIQADIQQRAPGVFTRRALSAFLHRYTTSTAYLKALVREAERSDLDGQPAGAVADEHRAAAQAELQRRKGVHDARRAAEREAARAADRAARDADRAARDADRAARDADRAARDAARQAEHAAHEEAHRQQEAEGQGRAERAALLRAYEATTLTRHNFCALKGIDERALDVLLEQARAERDRQRQAPRRVSSRS